jgi:hypothetical protein
MKGLSAVGLFVVALVVPSIGPAQAGSVQVGLTRGDVDEARIRLYEHETELRDNDPVGFDNKFPVLGKVIANEQGYDLFLSDHTFKRLWCVHTPFLWRVIEGDTLYHKLHPYGDPDPPPPESSSGSSGEPLEVE